jgi:hypothetical protein
MAVDYSVRTLKEQRNKLEDKIFQIADGQYDKYPKDSIDKLKTELTYKLRDIAIAIEVLEKHQNENVL